MNESQKEVHLTGFPLNWGREILGRFTLAPRVAPGSVRCERKSMGGGSEAGGSVAGESVAEWGPGGLLVAGTDAAALSMH